MGLFSRKTKTDAVEFSRDFYDHYVFGSDPTGIDFTSVLAETNRRLICEVDNSFAEISLPKLKDELLALRLEMIGTAWTHESKEEVALVISNFTKGYLVDIERSDLWEAMTDYNQAVSESVTCGADPNSRAGRARITFVNQMRFSLFKDWTKQGHDPDAAARVANRIDSEVSWKAGITQGLLAIRLTWRLAFEGSDPVWERLAAVAYGFYQGAKEALEGIKLTA